MQMRANKEKPGGIGRLGGYVRRRKRLIALTLSTVVVSTALGLFPPWLLQYGIDHYLVNPNPEYLAWVAVAMVLSAVIKGIFDFAKRYASEHLAHRVIHDIRSDVYRHLTRLSFSFYDSSRTGDLIARVTADADALKRFLANAFAFIVANVFTIMGVAFVVMRWDVRLGLVYLLFLPPMVHAMVTYAKRVRPAFGRVRRQVARLTEVLREDLLGIEVIKLYDREEAEREDFVDVCEQNVEANVGAARVSALWMPYVHFLLGAMTAAAVWYGGYLVITDELSIGVVAGFVGYTAMLMRPIRQTGMMMGFGSQALAASTRIFEVLNTEPQVRDASDAYALPPVEGNVRFREVSFSYDGVHWALEDINLDVDARKTIAIVGPTGAGKSTLVHLLPRFYDPSRGSISIDDHELSRVQLESLRDQVGIVLQDPFLFAASIRENISYGKPEARESEIRECASRAQIADFIETLPLGYETPVGERGVTLSGGQKQRIALARVLLTDPRILILDEPTSSVDAETEMRIQRAMEEVLDGRTSFVIAHRLWTVQHADRIVVMDDGKIQEIGTHEELLASDGLYAELSDALSTAPGHGEERGGVRP